MARVVPYMNLVPVFGGLIAWLAVGEHPTLLQLAGGLVVLAGVTLAR